LACALRLSSRPEKDVQQALLVLSFPWLQSVVRRAIMPGQCACKKGHREIAACLNSYAKFTLSRDPRASVAALLNNPFAIQIRWKCSSYGRDCADTKKKRTMLVNSAITGRQRHATCLRGGDRERRPPPRGGERERERRPEPRRPPPAGGGITPRMLPPPTPPPICMWWCMAASEWCMRGSTTPIGGPCGWWPLPWCIGIMPIG
jgi:hypothetical protein